MVSQDYDQDRLCLVWTVGGLCRSREKLFESSDERQGVVEDQESIPSFYKRAVEAKMLLTECGFIEIKRRVPLVDRATVTTSPWRRYCGAPPWPTENPS
jgi:hypothetical protein